MNTPKSLRTHIGIFGMTNAGKSTLLNKITGEEVSVVSDFEGTTTDLVFKNMELHGFGPVTFIDTPGFNDGTALGEKRARKTLKAMDLSDAAVYVIRSSRCENINIISSDLDNLRLLKEKIRKDRILILCLTENGEKHLLREELFKTESEVLYQNINDEFDKERFLSSLIRVLSGITSEKEISLTGNLVKKGNTVVLVMPQDSEAPKGRLIMPQVQTIRDLLDNEVTVISSTLKGFSSALLKLKNPPDLIITDSQCFRDVNSLKPKDVPLTSFSVLMSAFKGDIEYFKESAYMLDSLNENSRILICEACTHPPESEDIGTVKIPQLLRKKLGKSVKIDFTRGNDFEIEDKGYDLIIHCGACMFTRNHVMKRTEKAKKLGIPMSNYGIVMAYFTGILGDVVF